MANSLDGVLEYALQVGAVDLILAEGFVPALRIAGRVRSIPNAEKLSFGELESFFGPLVGESGAFCGGPWAKTEWCVILAKLLARWPFCGLSEWTFRNFRPWLFPRRR